MTRAEKIGKGQKKYFKKLSKKKKLARLRAWMKAGREAARTSITRSASLKAYWKRLSTIERWKRSRKWAEAGMRAASNKTTNTSIEKVLKRNFRKSGIKFISQKKVGAVSVDIFILPNICVFADGLYWHNLPNRKKRDLRINKTLMNLGYEVIRFPERMINEYIDCCVDTVLMTIGRSPTM